MPENVVEFTDAEELGISESHSSYESGYGVTCNGASDGVVEFLIPPDLGVGPYVVSVFNDSYSMRYSIKEDLAGSGGMLGQNLGFTFNNECFTTEIGLNRSYYLDREIKPNDTFMITFIFKTLGTFATGRNISN